MKAEVAAFNQEKALVWSFSVITNLRMELFQALEQARYVSLPHRKQSSRALVDMDTIVPEQDGIKTLNFSINSLKLLPQYTLLQVVL